MSKILFSSVGHNETILCALSTYTFNCYHNPLLPFIPAGINLLKVNNRNRARCEICSKLTIKTPEQWRRSGVFIVKFEHISHLLMFLLLTLNM